MMQVRDNKDGREYIEKLKNPGRERKVKDDLADSPGAYEELQKLRKEIKAFEKRLKLVETRTGKLWADKGIQIRKRGYDAEHDTE